MNRRERQWRNVRIWEWVIYFLLTVGSFLIFVTDAGMIYLWIYILFSSVSALWLVWRQYQVLDEFGKLCWLKSYAVAGCVLALGISLTLVVVLFENKGLQNIITLPALPIIVILTLSLLASWGTWHYLGWRDSRE